MFSAMKFTNPELAKTGFLTADSGPLVAIERAKQRPAVPCRRPCFLRSTLAASAAT
jgi:hypothetical protein